MGEEAERIGLVSMCVPDEELQAKAEEVAAKLAKGAQRPIRWSKYALNNWFRMAGPIFDNSATLELLSFNGPEVKEGLASLKEKRDPNFNFKVYIYAKHAEDGTKIIEQILPYFTPDWTTTVKLIPEMEIIMDIPVILNDIRYEDKYDSDFKERRAIVWTLDLTLKGYIYGPVKKSGIIKFVNTTFYIPNVPDGTLADSVGNTSPAERVTVQPGLLSNGSPVSWYGAANSSTGTIPYAEIEANNDFGYITQIYNTDELE
jgi:hypothetical protein